MKPNVRKQALEPLTPGSGGPGWMVISARFWRIYVRVWLASLLFPVVSLVQARYAAATLLIPVAGLVLFVLFYTWSMQPHPIRAIPDRSAGHWLSLAAIVVVTLLVLALSAAYGTAFLWLLVGTSAIAGKTLPARRAHVATGLLPLLCLGSGVALSGGPAGTNWLHLIPLAMLVRALGLEMIGLSLLSGTIRDLVAAQEELSRRAVREERLRLARDLHDLLGHTLSLIVLKSELASRLMEKTPDRAKSEIQELERIAREALREVRQAVAGYRQPTLLRELDGARQMLEAAGIACLIENAAGSLPPAVDTALAWVVREGVTNVIRHSRARQCTIWVCRTNRTIRAEIFNDGEPTRNDGTRRGGSGLVGLRERLETFGGSIQWEPSLAADGAGFRLLAELPLPDAATNQEMSP